MIKKHMDKYHSTTVKFRGQGQRADRIDEMILEIEELRQVNRRLKECGEKFQTVADSAYDWQYWLNPEGGFYYISPSCEKISGYPVAGFTQDQELLAKIIHPDDRKKMAEHFSETKELPETRHIEFRIVSATGEVKWIAHSCLPVYDSDGRYNGRRATNRDITERKDMEDELARREVQLRLAMDAASDGVWDINLQTGKTYFSENWVRSLGYVTNDDFVWEQAVHPKDLARIAAARQKHLLGESARSEVEFRVRDKEGKWHWLLSRGRIVEWNTAGQPNRYIGTYINIDKLKEVEAKLAVYQAELESRVAKRTAELEETNTALRVILKKRTQDRSDLEQQLLTNVQKLIGPYLDQLQATSLDGVQRNLLWVIKENLGEICSPFSQSLSTRFKAITPAEIKIANLIKAGKRTKEIAELLNLSPGTISIHRKNIRKKLGLTNQKANLQTNICLFAQSTHQPAE